VASAEDENNLEPASFFQLDTVGSSAHDLSMSNHCSDHWRIKIQFICFFFILISLAELALAKIKNPVDHCAPPHVDQIISSSLRGEKGHDHHGSAAAATVITLEAINEVRFSPPSSSFYMAMFVKAMYYILLPGWFDGYCQYQLQPTRKPA
jgi:hypothetical protein